MPYKVKPDVVNLAKGTEDALTKAGFWVDDKQVVSLTIEKWYVELDPPRIEVTIETL
jgi:Holliday junction resolvase RusA-like endonuclease